METVIITKEFANKCADALVDKHNEIAKRGHDSCTIVSFRQLYLDLCKLGFSWKIASAIHPVNERNFPLFLTPDGEEIPENAQDGVNGWAYDFNFGWTHKAE